MDNSKGSSSDSSNHAPETQEANLVVRHLKLEGIDDSNQRAMLNEIETTYGVDSASYEEPSATLHIAYNAMECRLAGLERIIMKHGGDVSHDWETTFKKGYYRFIDSNIRDHAVNEVWGHDIESSTGYGTESSTEYDVKSSTEQDKTPKSSK